MHIRSVMGCHTEFTYRNVQKTSLSATSDAVLRLGVTQKWRCAHIRRIISLIYRMFLSHLSYLEIDTGIRGIATHWTAGSTDTTLELPDSPNFNSLSVVWPIYDTLWVNIVKLTGKLRQVLVLPANCIPYWLYEWIDWYREAGVISTCGHFSRGMMIFMYSMSCIHTRYWVLRQRLN